MPQCRNQVNSNTRKRNALPNDSEFTFSAGAPKSYPLGFRLPDRGAFPLPDGAPGEFRGDGDFLLPVYLETGKNTEFTAATTCSFFLRFNPKTKTWKESNRIHSRLGNLQPSAVQLDDQKPFAKP